MSFTDIDLDTLTKLVEEGGSGERGVYARIGDSVLETTTPKIKDCKDEKEQASVYQGFANLIKSSKNKDKYQTLTYKKIRTTDHPFAVAVFLAPQPTTEEKPAK
jgi:hypothetical protein